MSTKADWTRINDLDVGILANKSPFPRSVSAPVSSRIVLESNDVETESAILEGIFALISPVMTFTLGLCVAIIK